MKTSATRFGLSIVTRIPEKTTVAARETKRRNAKTVLSFPFSSCVLVFFFDFDEEECDELWLEELPELLCDELWLEELPELLCDELWLEELLW